MQKLFSPVLALLLLLSIGACRSNKEELVLKGNEYFPLKMGVIRLYQIDSFLYDNYTGDIDTFSKVYREEIKDFYIDNAGDTNYVVNLSYYNIFRVKWEVQQSYSRKITGNYALENIYNHTQVKLLFPISKYKTKGSSYIWNLNMFNNDEGANVKYTSVFTSFDNGKRAFNDCVSIGLQKPEAGAVNNIYEEVYAKNIGLVYRHIDRSDFLTLGKRGGYEIFVRLLP
ncbi:MAG: hypothetical protein PSX81_11220 [bacterium]|nr:hypothetical protein [bacterium]